MKDVLDDLNASTYDTPIIYLLYTVNRGKYSLMRLSCSAERYKSVFIAHLKMLSENLYMSIYMITLIIDVFMYYMKRCSRIAVLRCPFSYQLENILEMQAGIKCVV